MADKFYTRTDNIDGVDEWLWIEGDSGLWQGPMENWNQSHKEKIRRYVIKFGTVVQAGGAAGMYPKLLSKMFGVVYTFEPDPSNFQCLVRNCRDTNVIMFNAALGDAPTWVIMRPGSDSNRGTHRVEVVDSGHIPQIAIDSIPFREVDLLWLDTEGYELNILKGARNTITKFKPIIMAEAGGKCVEFLKELGYEQVDQSVSDTVFKYKNP